MKTIYWFLSLAMLIFLPCHIKAYPEDTAPIKTMETINKILKRNHGNYKKPLSKKSKYL